MDLKRLSDLINKRGADSDSTTKSKKTKLNSKNATELPNVRVSSNRSPIYTDNPKDPRIKAYQDSLALYNLGKDYNKKVYNINDNKLGFQSVESSYKGWNKNDIIKNEKSQLKNNVVSEDDMKKYKWDINAIKQQRIYNDLAKKALSTNNIPVGSYSGEGYFPAFKKPVQPVIYKKPEPVKPTASKKVEEVSQQPQKVEQPSLREYSGNPVYAATPYSMGAGALIGFESKGNITYIAPEDYERFGVPSYAKKIIESKSKNK